MVIVLEDIYVDVTDLKISSSKERKHWSTDSFEMERRFKLKSEATQNQWNLRRQKWNEIT